MAFKRSSKRSLIYVGIRGAVVAVDKAGGAVVWKVELRRGVSFVPIVVEDDCVFAVSGGEISCLDADTGALIWHNPLKGLGRLRDARGQRESGRRGGSGGSPGSRRRQRRALTGALPRGTETGRRLVPGTVRRTCPSHSTPRGGPLGCRDDGNHGRSARGALVCHRTRGSTTSHEAARFKLSHYP
jgi:hypothetical protein